MLPDLARLPLSFARLGGMAAHTVWLVALLVGVVGCMAATDEGTIACLRKYPGWINCCPPGDHVDDGVCCPAGMHALTDVEHEDWKICVWDVDPCSDAGARLGHCLDLGANAAADAGVDAP